MTYISYQTYKELTHNGIIRSSRYIDESQFQPASLDVCLGDTAYRMRTSILPQDLTTVQQTIQENAIDRIDLTNSAVLSSGSIYIIPLMEYFSSHHELSGVSSAKSSTGRLDILARLITDYNTKFDTIKKGYTGKIYLEIVPRSFNIRVRKGTSLNQIRLSDSTEFHVVVPRRLDIHVDLSQEIMAYRAKRNVGVIDFDRTDYDPRDFWEEIPYDKRGLTLSPTEFYILCSEKPVSIPPDCAAEMVAYDLTTGTFRPHYAGFFDPGFHGKAVMEVREHEVPFQLVHEQKIATLNVYKLEMQPTKVYTADNNNYIDQKLRLSKQFVKTPFIDA